MKFEYSHCLFIIAVVTLLVSQRLKWEEAELLRRAGGTNQTMNVQREHYYERQVDTLLENKGSNLTLPFNKSHIPLSDLILDSNIVGDVSGLLDWAIVGHAKCGTTLLLRQMSVHPEISSPKLELAHLITRNPTKLVRDLYELPDGKRGYKQPHEINHPYSINYLMQYWPRAKLIVGVRHPILWFESFYNFRRRGNIPLPPAEQLIGPCRRGSRGVCTDGSRFHLHLALLGKTNLTEPEELTLLLSTNVSDSVPRRQRAPHRVFLYEISQLQDTNFTRRDQFRKDLGAFLDLNVPLGKVGSKSYTSRNSKYELDICENRYKPLRKELLAIAVSASLWIRHYFLLQTDVVTSSKSYLEQLLKSWMMDPCEMEFSNVTR